MNSISPVNHGAASTRELQAKLQALQNSFACQSPLVTLNALKSAGEDNNSMPEMTAWNWSKGFGPA